MVSGAVPVSFCVSRMRTLPSRAERRSRFVCKAAGVTCGGCLVLFLVCFELSQQYGLAPRPGWLMNAYLLSWTAILATGATCIVVGVFTRLKFKDKPNDRDQTEGG